MTARLEIRLDAERRRRLEELAESRQTSISDLVRELLDRGYEEWLRSQRLAAVQRMADLSIEDVPDPKILKQQLNETYEPHLR
jgi:hypothetical protein